MNPEDDEGRPGKSVQSSSRYSSDIAKDTHQIRRPQPWHTVGVADLITARSLRTSWHVTWRCLCGAKHRSIVRTLEGGELRRTSPCGQGKVVLHLHGLTEEVAA